MFIFSWKSRPLFSLFLLHSYGFLDLLMLLNLFSVSSGNNCPDAPMTITCRVLSTEMLKGLTNVHLEKNDLDLNASALSNGPRRSQSSTDANRPCSLVLAGLHACGDLSVTMLRLV